MKLTLRFWGVKAMTLAWIFERLQMGTKTHLVHLLHWHGKT